LEQLQRIIEITFELGNKVEACPIKLISGSDPTTTDFLVSAENEYLALAALPNIRGKKPKQKPANSKRCLCQNPVTAREKKGKAHKFVYYSKSITAITGKDIALQKLKLLIRPSAWFFIFRETPLSVYPLEHTPAMLSAKGLESTF
jgi:hypothetical protein